MSAEDRIREAQTTDHALVREITDWMEDESDSYKFFGEWIEEVKDSLYDFWLAYNHRTVIARDNQIGNFLHVAWVESDPVHGRGLWDWIGENESQKETA